MRTFFMKAVGVTYENRQRAIAKLKTGDALYFVLEPENKYDKYAVRIITVSGDDVGYVCSAYNKDIFMNIQNGQRYKLTVSQVTGGGNYVYGLNIRVDYEEEKVNVSSAKKIDDDDDWDDSIYDYSLQDYVNDNFGGDWSYYENQMDD